MKSARYPGVRPFETFQKDFFFGRDQDLRDLYNLVLLEKMVVLFARSGYGKSSLLNAGLVPRLQSAELPPDKRYLPLVARPGSFVEQPGPTVLPLRERLLHELEQQAPLVTAPFLDTFCDQKSLWYAFKRRQSADSSRFVLLFDQFEEFFTHPPDLQQQFCAELAELLYETIPQSVRRAARDSSEEQLAFLAQPMDIKVVFAIRGDRLALLDRMKTQLPAIFNRRFDLRALSLAQAKTAIVRPAQLPSPLEHEGRLTEFSSPSFEYDSAALDQILQQLASGRPGQEARIEAFQLQIVCTWIEDEVRAGRIVDRDGNGLPDVMPEDLPDFANIFETYYKQQVDKLPAAEQVVARSVVEEELLLVNPQSGEGRRLSVDKDLLLFKYGRQGLTEPLLQRLEDTFLLRREANALGGFSFEISHDALIEPIMKARAERQAEAGRLLALQQAEQDRLEAENRAREAEAQARAEAKRRAEAERLQREAEAAWGLAEARRKNARRLTLVAITLAVAASSLGVWAWHSAALAGERLEEIEKTSAERDLLEFRQLLNNGDELLDGHYYQSALGYYQTADTLRQRHRRHAAFQLAAQGLSEKISQCQSALQNR